MNLDSMKDLLATFWPILVAVSIGAICEIARPWKNLFIDRLRWLHAFVLFIVGVILINLIAPLGLIGVAVFSQENELGLFNYIRPPFAVTILIGVLVLDLASWVAHWTMHHTSILWRVHRVHHSDEMLDVSTGFRFHPFEVLYRFIINAIIVMLLGISSTSIIIYSALIICFDVWEHANMKSFSSYRKLEKFLITPNLHRLHHSNKKRHYDKNFGGIFCAWDRIFGTFLDSDMLDKTIEFGLKDIDLKQHRTMIDLMVSPFRK